MFISINKILPLVASRLKCQPEMEMKEIISIWPDVMTGFFGKKTNKIRPLFIKNKNLFIECPNPIWAGELQARSEEIIEAVNKRIRKKKVERLKFVF